MDANQERQTTNPASKEAMKALWSRVDEMAQDHQAREFGEQSGRKADAQTNDLAWQAGAIPSNTHPQSSHMVVMGFPDLHASCGIDWWEVRAAIAFDPISFQGNMEEFQAAKQLCQDANLPETTLSLVGVDPLRIARSGMVGRGEHFEYKITFSAGKLGLSRRQGTADGPPNCRVLVTGRECLLQGALEAYDKAKALIATFGGTILWEKLSRVDLCLDVANLDVRTFQPLAEGRFFISRAKSILPYHNLVGDKWTGLAVGKSPVRMIIYDKLREKEGSADALYLQALIDRRWGGTRPPVATRVEYQLSRSWLKDHGVSTPNDFLERQTTILEKLTGEWFRWISEPNNCVSKHQSRANVHPLWDGLRQAFKAGMGNNRKELIPLRRERVNPIKLIRQAAGCLRNAALQAGHICDTFDLFKRSAIILLNKAFPDESHRERFMAEYSALQSRHAA